MALVRDTAGGRYLPELIAKLGEVVSAECEQELVLRGEPVDEQTWVRVARQKTGPLFALLSGACGGDDAPLAAALTESGYRIGTAYQLADDLLDVVGSEDLAGKTLGGDARSRKYTLPEAHGPARDAARRRVSEQCAAAVACLADWPWARDAMGRYVKEDLLPVFHQVDDGLGASVRSAV
jgi:geranylgeranyl pyrophosphate synthase